MGIVELARLNSIRLIKTNEVTLIPMYMVKKMVKVRVPGITPRENPHKVIAAVLKNINDRMEVIKVHIEEKRHW